MFDTLQNLVTGLGMRGIDSSTAAQYILTQLDRNTLENMYRGDWLARKICDAPAEDMTREWRAWQANQKQIEALEEVEKTLDLQRKVKQWIIKARLYGGSALVIGVDDGQDPSQPIDLKKCKTGCLKYVVVLHRYELNAGPRIYNVQDPYYTRAAYYTVATPMFGFEGQQGITQPTLPGQPTTVPGATVPIKKSGFFGNVVPFGKSKANNSYYNTIPNKIDLTQIHHSYYCCHGQRRQA
jgi:phage-related protein (TIGR01555 family)